LWAKAKHEEDESDFDQLLVKKANRSSGRDKDLLAPFNPYKFFGEDAREWSLDDEAVEAEAEAAKAAAVARARSCAVCESFGFLTRGGSADIDSLAQCIRFLDIMNSAAFEVMFVDPVPAKGAPTNMRRWPPPPTAEVNGIMVNSKRDKPSYEKFMTIMARIRAIFKSRGAQEPPTTAADRGMMAVNFDALCAMDLSDRSMKRVVMESVAAPAAAGEAGAAGAAVRMPPAALSTIKPPKSPDGSGGGTRRIGRQNGRRGRRDRRSRHQKAGTRKRNRNINKTKRPLPHMQTRKQR